MQGANKIHEPEGNLSVPQTTLTALQRKYGTLRVGGGSRPHCYFALERSTSASQSLSSPGRAALQEGCYQATPQGLLGMFVFSVERAQQSQERSCRPCTREAEAERLRVSDQTWLNSKFYAILGYRRPTTQIWVCTVYQEVKAGIPELKLACVRHLQDFGAFLFYELKLPPSQITVAVSS